MMEQFTDTGDIVVDVSVLTGTALDFWVALALGGKGEEMIAALPDRTPPPYSTEWAVGGPVLHAQKIATTPIQGDKWVGIWQRPQQETRIALPQHVVGHGMQKVLAAGPAPLVAGMRAFVAAICGTRVTLPPALHGCLEVAEQPKPEDTEQR